MQLTQFFFSKTKRRGLILLSWMVPILVTCIMYYAATSQSDYICIPTHMNIGWTTASIIIFLISIVVIYLLYGYIIFTYFRLKQRTWANNRTHIRLSIEAGSHPIKPLDLLRFLNNSKYVIFVLSSLTVCWMPGIVFVLGDFFFHNYQDFERSLEERCHLLAAQNLTQAQKNLGISCMEDLNIGYVTECEVPGVEGDVCVAFHSYTHDFFIVCIIRLCMFMVVLASFTNPIIHGFCYPGFRKIVSDWAGDR